MPNIKPLTYRELHTLFSNLGEINNYVSAHPFLKDPYAFTFSFNNCLRVPDPHNHIITALNFPEKYDLIVPIDDLVMLLAPYANIAESLLQSEPLRGEPIPTALYRKYFLKYECYPMIPRERREEHFFTRILGNTKHDQTSIAIADFRLFYSSYIFWNHRTLVSHYISSVYKFEGIRRVAATEGPILETQGGTYDVYQYPAWSIFDDDMIHKTSCHATSYTHFRHYYQPQLIED